MRYGTASDSQRCVDDAEYCSAARCLACPHPQPSAASVSGIWHALRRQAKDQLETPYDVYVPDRQQRLLGVVLFWELFTASAGKTIQELMRTDVVFVTTAQDQETIAALIAQHDLLALPVVDDAGRIQGIVTVDDIVDVVQEEATEDIQKLAGMEAFDRPYLQTSFTAMLKKRAGWLAVLFLGERVGAFGRHPRRCDRISHLLQHGQSGAARHPAVTCSASNAVQGSPPHAPLASQGSRSQRNVPAAPGGREMMAISPTGAMGRRRLVR